MQDTRQGSGKRSTPRTIQGKVKPSVSADHQQALQQYQSGLLLMQEGKFEKARVIFAKLVDGGTPELLERSRVYLIACERNANRSALSFDSPEEQYDYAISLLNTGDYEEARDHFNGILKSHSGADYAYYGLAILDSITGQAEECLEHLSRSIELNSQNRIQARSDSDFQDMADDPRFTELLYPETP
jgi:tetratricopeptide (TPR) repeat protein